MAQGQVDRSRSTWHQLQRMCVVKPTRKYGLESWPRWQKNSPSYRPPACTLIWAITQTPGSLFRPTLQNRQCPTKNRRRVGKRIWHHICAWRFYSVRRRPTRGGCWLPIPSDFLQGELSADEIQAVVGRAMMIRWDILPGKFFREVNSGELMRIGFGIFPAKFF